MFHVHELLTENSHHQTLLLPPVIISLFYYLSIIQILGFVNYSNLKKTTTRMPQNGKLMPNIDQQSTKLLNLTVLQRIDPLVEEILITAAHVTLYQFNIDLTQWVS